jgi:hypothetical protein
MQRRRAELPLLLLHAWRCTVIGSPWLAACAPVAFAASACAVAASALIRAACARARLSSSLLISPEPPWAAASACFSISSSCSFSARCNVCAARQRGNQA